MKASTGLRVHRTFFTCGTGGKVGAMKDQWDGRGRAGTPEDPSALGPAPGALKAALSVARKQPLITGKILTLQESDRNEETNECSREFNFVFLERVCIADDTDRDEEPRTTLNSDFH